MRLLLASVLILFTNYLASEGELCNGIAGIKCQRGLVCVVEDYHVDGAGICVKEHELDLE